MIGTMNWVATGINIHVHERPPRKKQPEAIAFAVDSTRDDSIYYFTGDKNLYHQMDEIISKIDFGKKSITGLIFDGKDTLYFTAETCVLKYCIPTKIVSVFKERVANTTFEIKSIPQGDLLQGITMDKKGDLYVICGYGIYQISATSGTVMKKVSTPPHKYPNPYLPLESLAVCEDTIYATDRMSNCVRKFKNDMEVSQITLPFSPQCLAVDADGNLLVIASGIYKINTKTDAVTKLHTPEGLRSVHSVVRDHQGNLWFGGWSLMKMAYVWNWERFLWIAHMKEAASYCNLARLPTELIREIAWHLKPAPPLPAPRKSIYVDDNANAEWF